MKTLRELAWIPTAIQLPSEETEVLLFRRGKIVIGERVWDHPNHEDSYQSFWYWACPNEYWIDDEDEATVTHWMPLPEVPKP